MDSNLNLLILERSQSILESSEDYTLSGIFTELGVRNRNGRVYEEDFLNHIDELKKKMTSSKLLGELDHPQNFEISLKNASHVIEDINYDPSTRKVMGKIRLLDTDAGKQAKALVDAGVPLHISSRAAGSVDEEGGVSIKKLFTYDLVADPGFENAQLTRMNESFGLSEDDNMQIFEMNNNGKETGLKEEKSEVVTTDQFNEYSKHIINKLKNLEEKVSGENEGSLKEEFNTFKDEVTKYFDYIKTNKALPVDEDAVSIKEDLENFKKEMVSYMEYIRQGHNSTHNYLMYMSENFNELVEEHNIKIEHSDHIAENVQSLTDYIGYKEGSTESLTETVDNLKKHNDYLAETIEGSINYQEYIKENLEKVGSYSEYLSEKLEQVGSYSEYLAENIETIANSETRVNEKETKVEETKVEETKVEESTTVSYEADITAKLEELINEAKKQEAKFIEDETLHFLNFVNESKKEEFQTLADDQKQRLIDNFASKDYTNEADVVEKWDSLLTETFNGIHFLRSAEEKYQALFSSLNESQRNSIAARAEYYDFHSQEVLEDFWLTIEKEYTGVNLEKEKVNEEIIKEYDKFKFNDDYMNSVMEGIKETFGRK